MKAWVWKVCTAVWNDFVVGFAQTRGVRHIELCNSVMGVSFVFITYGYYAESSFIFFSKLFSTYIAFCLAYSNQRSFPSEAEKCYSGRFKSKFISSERKLTVLYVIWPIVSPTFVYLDGKKLYPPPSHSLYEHLLYSTIATGYYNILQRVLQPDIIIIFYNGS